MSAVHGVLVVDKPSGPTSHDLVARARKLYATRQVGHAGTLDPLASGVLVLMFGEACKLSQYLTAQAKRYRAEIRFGTGTDTLDAAGSVVETCSLAPGWLAPERLARALAKERVRTEQVPPQVSAIQVAGVRAHRAARRGEVLELSPRAVRVEKLEPVSATDTTLTLELEVSKGYYVRALARDLGAELGVPAHLGLLRRLASGAFSLEDAVDFPRPEPAPLLSLVEAARRALPCVGLTEEGAARARTGKPLGREHFESEPPEHAAGWLSKSDLIAVGQRDSSGDYRVLRGFTPSRA